MQIYQSQNELLSDWWEFFKAVDSSAVGRKDKGNKKNPKKHLEKVTKRMEKTLSNNVSFFLLELFRKYKLNKDEQMIFMYTLISEISPVGYPMKEVKNILAALYSHPGIIIKKAKLLLPSARLIKQKLLSICRERDSVLDARITIHPRITHALIEGKNVKGLKKQEARVPGNIFIVRNPRVCIEQVILSEEKRKQLEELITYLKKRPRLLKTCGMKETIEKGTGFILLFTGPPGTGKTLAAEAIAKELKKKLYMVNYAQLQNKFVGETEKNIEAVFEAIGRDKAVGLFDEADAVFSNRTSVQTSVDVAYNREVLLLLQRIEEFDGILILTTNRDVAFDNALARRITFKIKFDFPEATEREKIWRILMPPGLKIDKDVDFPLIAERFALSGGDIKNAVLKTLIKAAVSSSGSPVVRMEHLLVAAEEEYSKLRRKGRDRIGFLAKENILDADYRDE